LLIFSLALLLGGFLFFQKFVHPKIVNSASLTSASATLSNPRLSYLAGVTTGTAGSSHLTIDTTGNPDINTNHLFPSDALCFAPSNLVGCTDNTTYTVANIVDADEANLTTALTSTLNATDLAIASASGSLTISFTTVNQIPANGDILITIPMADNASGNDGFPDSASGVTTGGFDLNGIAAGDISVSGCSWNATETISVGSGTTDHTIRIDATAACAASTALTVTIDSSPGIVNPPPITSGHTQGTADVYTINVKTRDGSDSTLDETDIKVAPVEAVLVSATVDETLSFAVAGLATGSYCGQTTDVTTYAYSIPWGTLSTANSFSEAAQQLTVSTNADGGYTVKIEENDQMGKNGGACTGASAGESVNCIKDTTCDATCSESTSTEWTTATNNGLGFSLANVSGTDASFLYNESSRTFSSRQIADQEASETKANIMSNSAPVSGSSVYVCYRISISATQPAGYYYNKVKYTATASF
jgi:hypothetical protein